MPKPCALTLLFSSCATTSSKRSHRALVQRPSSSARCCICAKELLCAFLLVFMHVELQLHCRAQLRSIFLLFALSSENSNASIIFVGLSSANLKSESHRCSTTFVLDMTTSNAPIAVFDNGRPCHRCQPEAVYARIRLHSSRRTNVHAAHCSTPQAPCNTRLAGILARRLP